MQVLRSRVQGLGFRGWTGEGWHALAYLLTGDWLTDYDDKSIALPKGGGCRWLMCEETLGAFLLSLGSLG